MVTKCELYNDNFQNYKVYNIPAKAQLVIADIPYNLGKAAYGSNPMWYQGGDNRNGESEKAGKSFFNTDGKFNIAEFFHFCSKLLIKEPKERGKAPAMIVFCAWQQIPMVQEYGKKHGFMNAYPLYFIKNNSSQALKANMKIVGAVENAMVLYRDKLPKFNNEGRMIFNWFQWRRDGNDIPNIHPTQKPVNLLNMKMVLGGGEKEMVIERIARYQRERDAVFEKWENGTIDENVARVAATTITVWIEKLAGVAEEL